MEQTGMRAGRGLAASKILQSDLRGRCAGDNITNLYEDG
jgi:hypothetical protein